jgi:hypothetical protein
MNSTLKSTSAEQIESPVAQFLQAYEANAAARDIAAILAQFSDPFMAAGPTGVQCLRSADFAAALPKRVQLFAGLGAQPSKLVSCEETRLDARFVMAETRWQMTFIREGQPTREALADSLFILDTAGETPKIIFYLAHKDLMATLREGGILPM